MSDPCTEAVAHLGCAEATSPESLRAHAVEAVRIASQADSALFYTCADAEPDQPVVRVALAGTVPRVEDAFHEEAWTIAELNRQTRDLRRTPRPQRARFHRLRDFPPAYRREFTRSQHYDRIWVERGVVDALRLLVFDDDGTFCGWIGGVQARGSASFSVAQRRSAQRMARAVRDALVTAARCERARRPSAPGLLVATPSGEIELASPSAARWLELPSFRRALDGVLARSSPSPDAAAIETQIGDAHARVYRLAGAGGDRIAVHLEALPPIGLSPVAALTDAQRAVVDLAVIGLTVQEIAAELCKSPHTVKEHLKAVYRQLGVANRLELADALERR